ncbi:MAG: AMP-binding protein, partial [Burkholderiales bacterium]
IALLDAAGRVSGEPGDEGEIVVRGPSVFAGYGVGDSPSRGSFLSEGWFRTGDLGRFDAEGYLRVEGRLKDLIRRGGEKISPREVDEVLMDHPAVAQVVT